LVAGGSAALALGLAACGQTGGEPASTAPSAAPVTFQYWDWAANWKDLVQKLVEAHQAKHQNVTIQWDIAQDYWTKLQVAIAGDTAPDTWRMNGPNLPQWASQGLLQDLTTYFSKDKDASGYLKAMASVIVDYTKRDGKQWTMPFGQAISGIIAYNQDILTAEGLTPPAEQWTAGKWTWALLEEYAVKLTRRDGSRFGYNVEHGAETGWFPFLLGDGGALFDKEGKHSAINSPQARETFDYFVDMAVKQQVSPKPDELKQQNAMTRFLNGNVAMLPQGSWQIADLNAQAKAFKWDLVPVPQAPSTRKNGSTNQMSSLAMSKNSKQKDAVWDWAKLSGSKEGQDIIAQNEFFPARNDSAEEIYYLASKGPAHRPLLRDVLKVTQAYPWLDIAGNSSGWGPIVNPLIDQILNGQVSVKDGVQQLDDQLKSAIDRGFK
jgi:multiple sugar transport system substrate-binding protein